MHPEKVAVHGWEGGVQLFLRPGSAEQLLYFLGSGNIEGCFALLIRLVHIRAGGNE